MTQTIALIGAGAMGGAIGARLLATGTPLVVFDLDPDRVAALTARGATSAMAFRPGWLRCRVNDTNPA